MGCLGPIHRKAVRLLKEKGNLGICSLQRAFQKLHSWLLSYDKIGRTKRRNHVILLYLQMQPIYQLLRHTNLGPLETKRQNLRRALDQYLMEFNACRCGPCFNNGEPILEGTSCRCQCSKGRQGPACEHMVLEVMGGKTHAFHSTLAWHEFQGSVHRRKLWDF